MPQPMNLLLILLLLITMATLALLVTIHLGFMAPRLVEQGTPAALGLKYKEVRITTTQGAELFAWLLPTAPTATTLIILHGWGANAELMLPLALPFHHAGMNVLLLDARSHGKSDSASFSSLPRFAEDVAAAADWIKAEQTDDSAKIVLLGHSVGAGAALFAASRRDDIAAVISLSAFAHPAWMMRRQMQHPLLPRFLVSLILRYIQWVIGHSYTEIAPLYTASQTDCPVLLVHGSEDKIVPLSDAKAIKQHSADAAVELLIIEGAGHDSVNKIREHGAELVSFLECLNTH